MSTARSKWFVLHYGNILIDGPQTEAERAFNDRVETLAIRVTGGGFMAIHAKAALDLVKQKPQEYLRAVANEWMNKGITEMQLSKFDLQSPMWTADYSEFKQAAEQVKSNKDLLAVVNKADQLFLAGFLKMTDKDWMEFTSIVRARSMQLCGHAVTAPRQTGSEIAA